MKTKRHLNNLLFALSGLCLLAVTTEVTASTCPVLTSVDAPSGYTAYESNVACALTGPFTFEFAQALIPSDSGPMICQYFASSSSGHCMFAYSSNATEAPSTSDDADNWESDIGGSPICSATDTSNCTFTEEGDSTVTTCPIFTSANYTANTVTSFTGFSYIAGSCASTNLPVLEAPSIQGGSGIITCNYIVPSDGVNATCGIGYQSENAVTPTGDYWVTSASTCSESSANDCVATP